MERGRRSLVGGLGNDLIYGGIGDDFIIVGQGKDTIHGGQGNDTVSFFEQEQHIDLDLNIGESSTVLLLDKFEAIYGANFDDHIIGSNANETIMGGSGNDTIYGGAGDDVLGVRYISQPYHRSSGGNNICMVVH